VLLYLSDQLRKISFRGIGFIERGQFLSTQKSIFIYPYTLMLKDDYFFIDKNKITSQEEFVKALDLIGRKLKKQYQLSQEEGLYKVTRVL
jgi:hypothetical protein